jgi:transposase InsO family protein
VDSLALRNPFCFAYGTAWARAAHGPGSPYASEEYRAALARRGIVARMSRTGDCYDNAVAESFFATLKTEHVDHESFVDRGAGHASIADYIETFYNSTRRHSHLGYVSPIEFELTSHVAAIAAQSDCPRRRGKITCACVARRS